MRSEFTMRLDKKTHDKLKRLAAESFTSVNGYIESLIKERINGVGSHPVVVHGTDGYYVISPLGYFTKLNTHMFKRFIRGSIPPLSEDWEEAFDNFEDAVSNMGTVVCAWSGSGVIIKDIDRFLDLLTSNII